MHDFESGLLEKSKQLITERLKEQKTTYQAQLEDLNNQTASGISTPYIELKQHKLKNLLLQINNLETAESLDSFLRALEHYLTLSSSSSK